MKIALNELKDLIQECIQESTATSDAKLAFLQDYKKSLNFKNSKNSEILTDVEFDLDFDCIWNVAGDNGKASDTKYVKGVATKNSVRLISFDASSGLTKVYGKAGNIKKFMKEILEPACDKQTIDEIIETAFEYSIEH